MHAIHIGVQRPRRVAWGGGSSSVQLASISIPLQSGVVIHHLIVEVSLSDEMRLHGLDVVVAQEWGPGVNELLWGREAGVLQALWATVVLGLGPGHVPAPLSAQRAARAGRQALVAA